MSVFHFSGCYRQAYFHYGRQKKVVAGWVRQVAILHSDDCTGIHLGGLSSGHLKWSSYSGGCLNRFYCNALS